MAKSWQYPRSRRILMQGVMWLLLGATVSLAALVTHLRAAAFRVELGEAETHDGMSLSLPREWVRDEKHRFIHVVEREEDAAIVPRQLIVHRISAETETEAIATMVERLGLERVRDRRSERIEIDGHGGVLITAVHTLDPQLDRMGLFGKLVGAVAVIPDDEAVLIALIGAGRIDRSDSELVRNVARSIRIIEPSATTQANDLE